MYLFVVVRRKGRVLSRQRLASLPLSLAAGLRRDLKVSCIDAIFSRQPSAKYRRLLKAKLLG